MVKNIESQFGSGKLKAMPLFKYGLQPKKFKNIFGLVKIFSDKNFNNLSIKNKKNPPTKTVDWRVGFSIFLKLLSDGFFARNTSAAGRSGQKAFFLDWFFAVFANSVFSFF